SHGAVEVTLLPPQVVVSDVLVTSRTEGSARIRRVAVQGVYRGHVPPHAIDLRLEGVSARLATPARPVRPVRAGAASRLAELGHLLGAAELKGEARLAYRF